MSTINRLWAIVHIQGVCCTRVWNTSIPGRGEAAGDGGTVAAGIPGTWLPVLGRRGEPRSLIPIYTPFQRSILVPVSVYSCVMYIKKYVPGAIAGFFNTWTYVCFWVHSLSGRGLTPGQAPGGSCRVCRARRAGGVSPALWHPNTIWFTTWAVGSLIAQNNCQLLNLDVEKHTEVAKATYM